MAGGSLGEGHEGTSVAVVAAHTLGKGLDGRGGVCVYQNFE